MRLEENVVRCAVLSDDPRHVIALLLFARGVLMARSDDDQVAFGGSVEQRRELVVIEARHVVELPAGRFGQCRQHLVGLNIFDLHFTKFVGNERAGAFEQRPVLHHQAIAGTGREVVRPRPRFEFELGTGFGITSPVIPVERLDLRGIGLPVLLSRGRIAEIVVKVVVCRRSVRKQAHLHPRGVDSLRHEPVVTQTAAQVVHIETEDGCRIGLVDLQNTPFHFAAHRVLFGFGGIRGPVGRRRDFDMRRELIRVERPRTRIIEITRFVVGQHMQSGIEGRHRAESGIKIVIRRVVTVLRRALRHDERHDQVLAGKSQLRTAGGAFVPVEGHLDLGISRRAFRGGERKPLVPGGCRHAPRQ